MVMKGKIKILYVEDVDFNFELIEMYLEEIDFEIKKAENGKQALEILKIYEPDIILMDIHMPALNGYEATKIIKNDEILKSIPVVALTAYASEEDLEKYSGVFDDYLTKPITQEALLESFSKFFPI